MEKIGSTVFYASQNKVIDEYLNGEFKNCLRAKGFVYVSIRSNDRVYVRPFGLSSGIEKNPILAADIKRSVSEDGPSLEVRSLSPLYYDRLQKVVEGLSPHSELAISFS